MIGPGPAGRRPGSPGVLGLALIVASMAGCEGGRTPAAEAAAPSGTSWCSNLPRPANAALPSSAVDSEWFRVYEAASGVFAIVEPFQFQETISYLIVGSRSALLFDTGLGMVPLRPLVAQLTALPVTVINSHTHFDHVGGNAEFDRILAIDSPYTRANMAGFSHAELASEVAGSAFCGGAPAGLDTAAFSTRPWQARGFIADGDTIDLGGRVIEVLHVPGHTPDAVALLDRAHGLLWTGDTWYDGTLWLYVPETDLDAYLASMARLIAIAPVVKQLLPAHNTAVAHPGRLAGARAAVEKMRAAPGTGRSEPGGRLVFEIDGVTILTSAPLLEGRRGDPTRGGSGLTTWP